MPVQKYGVSVQARAAASLLIRSPLWVTTAGGMHPRREFQKCGNAFMGRMIYFRHGHDLIFDGRAKEGVFMRFCKKFPMRLANAG